MSSISNSREVVRNSWTIFWLILPSRPSTQCELKDYATALRNEVASRFCSVDTDKLYLVAVFLDPNFKTGLCGTFTDGVTLDEMKRVMTAMMSTVRMSLLLVCRPHLPPLQTCFLSCWISHQRCSHQKRTPLGIWVPKLNTIYTWLKILYRMEELWILWIIGESIRVATSA